MSRRRNPPALVHHRPTGQGRIRINGRDVYLGVHGTPECAAAYAEQVRRWHLSEVDPSNLTVDVLCLRHRAWADAYYRRRDGTPTRGADSIRDSLRPVVAALGTKLVRDVTPPDLLVVRERMIADGLARKTINGRIGKVRAAFCRRR